MAKVLTAKSVEAEKSDRGGRKEIADAALPGLYLVVQPSGSKSWALRYRFGGRPRKMTLGAYPAFGLKEARISAREALQLIEHGRDPGAEKVDAKRRLRERDELDRDTVAAVVGLFIRRHVSQNRTAKDQARIFEVDVLPKWGRRRIQDITKRDAVELLDGIVDRGSPVMANRVRALLNTMFNWAEGRDIIQKNPLDGVKPPTTEKSRERVLDDSEIRLFWRACDAIDQPFGPLFKLLLLTAQRRGEVAEMTDSEIDQDLWTIPGARTKNGDEHLVPLSGPAQAILGGVDRIGRGMGYVFTTTGLAPVSGFTRAGDRLRGKMAEIASAAVGAPVEIKPFTLHDLRRTATTGMARLGFPRDVTEAVINHRSGTRSGVAGIYNRFTYAKEKRQALEAWSRLVLELVDGAADNVVRLADAGR